MEAQIPNERGKRIASYKLELIRYQELAAKLALDNTSKRAKRERGLWIFCSKSTVLTKLRNLQPSRMPSRIKSARLGVGDRVVTTSLNAKNE